MTALSRNRLAIRLGIAALVLALPLAMVTGLASANTVLTVSYGFESTSDITDNFDVTVGAPTTSGDITRASSGGIDNSGAVAIASSGSAFKQAVMGSKTTYTMAEAPVGSTYTFESFVNSQGTNGYSGMGFSVDPSTASAGSGRDIVYRPDDGIGVSVHGSGFYFHNGSTNYQGYWAPRITGVPANDFGIREVKQSACQGLINMNTTTPGNDADGDPLYSCASNDGWYRLVLKLEIATETTFDLRVEVWRSSSSGADLDSEAGSVYELNGVTNSTIRNADTLSSYVNFSGDRFRNFDDYSVTLDGGATFVEAGAPVVSTSSASATGYVVTVSGNLSSANGGTVSDRGFVYSTAANPTVSDTKVTVGSVPFATGSFSGQTQQLAVGTYYFRSFAENQNGISYGVSKTVVVSHPINSLGFTETIVESGKNVGTILNGGTSTISGVFGLCYAQEDAGVVTVPTPGSTSWAVADTYSRANETSFVVDHYYLLFYDGTSTGMPSNCGFVTDTSNPSVRSSLLRVYPSGELSSDGVTKTLGLNQRITPIDSLQNAGWPGSLTYSISPALPSGLNLNTSSGTISGTPTAVSSATEYTISAVTPRSGSRGDANIWDATATLTLAVQVVSSGGTSGSSSSASTAVTPVVPAPAVAPRPSRLAFGPPDTPPVRQPVDRSGAGFDPDAPARATIGGIATSLIEVPVGSDGFSFTAGAFQFGVRVNGADDVELATDTSSSSRELFVPSGQPAVVSGGGSYPGSFVQFWLPGNNGTEPREISRIQVGPDGSFGSDLTFDAGASGPPVPIGRQVLQVVGYDEEGNQTVVDMTINIGQGAPAPEPNRKVGELPALSAGQSLATSGGMSQDVSVTGLPEADNVVVEGPDWVVNVSADRDYGVVETDEGRVLVRLDQSSVGTTSGSGFMAGTLASVWLFSEPTLMATVTVDDNGEFSSEFLVDARLIAPGEHTLQVQGVGQDGLLKAANLGVVVEQPVVLTSEGASSWLFWVVGLLLLALLLILLFLLARRRRSERASQPVF